MLYQIYKYEPKAIKYFIYYFFSHRNSMNFVTQLFKSIWTPLTCTPTSNKSQQYNEQDSTAVNRQRMRSGKEIANTADLEYFSR